jgi:hypothetical protein
MASRESARVRPGRDSKSTGPVSWNIPAICGSPALTSIELKRSRHLQLSYIFYDTPEGKPKTRTLNRLSRLIVRLPEAEARMERIQCQHARRHHCALQPDEVLLSLDQVPVPPLAQLRDTVHAPREDAQRRERQRHQESPEQPAAPQLVVPWVQRLLLAQRADAAPGLERKVAREQDEDEQREDLEAEAGEHDVVAGRGAAILVRRDRCHATARRLQDEREKVADDEDARVHARGQARVVGAEGDDDAREAEVDSRRVEGRGDGQAHDLQEERVLRSLLAMCLRHVEKD